MVVNEDYFKDIDISDDDVNDSTRNDDLYNDCKDVKQMLDYMSQRYEGMITFSVHPRKNFYNTTKDAIGKIIKRFGYICSIYNVEHSDVFVVDSNTLSNIDDAGVEPQIVRGYVGNKVITKTGGVKNIFNTISLYTCVELCVYVNFRKFGSYRDAYWFVHILYDSIYKINDSQRFPYIDEIWFFSEPKSFMKGSHGECFFKAAKWNCGVFFFHYWSGERSNK